MDANPTYSHYPARRLDLNFSRIRTVMNLKLIGFLAIIAGSALSQTVATARPEFAVVSIKPNESGCCPVYGVGNGAGGGKYVTLKMLIAFAYRFSNSRSPKDQVGSTPIDSMLKVRPKTQRPISINCGLCCALCSKIDSI